jgi:hypothetical protein
MQVPFNPTEIFWYHFGTMLHTPPPHTHTHTKRGYGHLQDWFSASITLISILKIALNRLIYNLSL